LNELNLNDVNTAENLSELLFDKNPLPMWIYDKETLKILAVNNSAIDHYGFSIEEFMAMTIADLRPSEDMERLKTFLSQPHHNEGKSGSWIHCKKNGALIDVDIISHSINYHERPARLVFAYDITERKHEERNTKLQSAALNSAANSILITTREGEIIWSNPAFSELTGYTAEEVHGKNPRFLKSGNQNQAFYKNLWDTILSGEVWHGEHINRRKDGSQYNEEQTITPVLDSIGDITHFIAIKQNITERNQAQETNKILSRAVNQSDQIIYVTDRSGIIDYVNPAFEQITGFTKEETIGQTPRIYKSGLHTPEEYAWLWKMILAGETLHNVVTNRKKSGELFYEEKTITPLRDENGKITHFVSTGNDITSRKLAEDALHKSEQFQKNIVENIPIMVFIKQADTLQYVNLNKAGEKLIGLTKEEYIDKNDYDFFPKHEADFFTGKDREVIRNKSMVDIPEETIQTKNLGERILHTKKIPLYDSQGNPQYLLGISEDITERKRVEKEFQIRLAELEAVNQISTALRTAQNLDEMLPVLMDVTLECMQASMGSIWLYDATKNELKPVITRGWGEENGMPVQKPVKPGEGLMGFVFESGRPYSAREFRSDPHLSEIARKWILPGIGGASVPIFTGESVIGVFTVNVELPRELTNTDVHLLSTLSEIAGTAIQRTSLKEQTDQRLQQLAALSDIEHTISSSFDLNLNLSVILNHVISQLGIDAADILLFNANSQMLLFSQGRGFRTKAIENSRLRLGESHAGKVALERRLLQVQNLQDPGNRLLTHLLSSENFVNFIGVPLIAKGQLKGVLEIFHRTPLNPDTEWLNFLTSLADQAAIAIDNSTLFENLQRSNIELSLAYDETIEGWSKALDLRDNETEGHTQRVANTTIQLAQLFDFPEEMMINIRWGALLHDIGKMGVPDPILLKPGPLTDDEWVIMKKHPEFAYNMLAPIHYLKNALEIPYCHHEKWDGSGYPRGLKNDQIPLATRIFMIVDVWDALLSDRPYRKAWSENKVLDYLRSLSGSHFDPIVLEKCLNSGLLVRDNKYLIT
jgi:PAS domain S-box-containing protein